MAAHRLTRTFQYQRLGAFGIYLDECGD